MDVHATVVAQAPSSGRGRFLGEIAAYQRLLKRDAVPLVATLGLYRFWVSTDVRQYLWSRSEIGGEQLDYTGHPIELLVGFLVLLVVIGPVLAILSILSVIPVLSVALVSAYLPVMVLAPLSILALYQARRYRVNHTVFRGIRFHQTGSAWVYAILTVLWFAINVCTLGLTYPWARASLERYKMRHTFYGDVQGNFQGSGKSLFQRGMLLWAVIWVPFLVVLAAFSERMGSGGVNTFIVGWLGGVGLVIYPIFHAMVLRWRIAGMRFGTLSFESDFPTWQLHKAYLKFFGLLGVIAAVVLMAAAQVQTQIIPALPLGRSIVVEFIGVLCLAVAYFTVATVITLAYQATVRFTTWHLIVDALVLHGLDQLDRTKFHPGHAARHSGSVGAALNVGGF